jgi:hypothetical protein
MVFKCFLSVSETCLKCFIYLQTDGAVLYLNISKVDESVTHVMRVGNGMERERSHAQFGGEGDVRAALASREHEV